MNKLPPVLLRRSDVRLAVAAGLSNAFATFTGLPYGYYAPLAVLAVTSGTYGSAVGLGRQRVLGTVLGALVLVAFYEGLHGIPFALGIALALGLQRLLGGLLNLQVGYKVGGMIIVMGWLVHHSQLGAWVPMRLFWTVFGILVALASLRLLWPTSTLRNTWNGWAAVLRQLAEQLRIAAAFTRDPLKAAPVAPGPRSTMPIVASMMAVRGLKPALLDELGGPRSTHPALPLLELIDESCSRLVGVVEALQHRHPHQPMGDLAPIREGEAALMETLAERLECWAELLGRDQQATWAAIPQAPTGGLKLPQAWLEAQTLLADPEVNRAALDRLKRVAARLRLLRQAIDALQNTELQWHHQGGRRRSRKG
jgi:hypothetical protein